MRQRSVKKEASLPCSNAIVKTIEYVNVVDIMVILWKPTIKLHWNYQYNCENITKDTVRKTRSSHISTSQLMADGEERRTKNEEAVLVFHVQRGSKTSNYVKERLFLCCGI
eukprot:scaffold654_cov253-Chaetoceros_neogracile.AAC.8